MPVLPRSLIWGHFEARDSKVHRYQKRSAAHTQAPSGPGPRAEDQQVPRCSPAVADVTIFPAVTF